MLSASEFRRIALKLEGAIESSHMNHPDFRANGRIFATLGYPDTKWGALTLTPEQQEHYVGEDPGTFVPAAGAWGRAGSTTVKLASADEAVIREAIRLAWENTAKKRKRKAARRRRLS